jgi:hypothetical protein
MNIKSLPAKLLLLFSATLLLPLSACGTVKTTQQPVSVPITTEAQAISVAASYIPSLIFTKARVVASKAYIGSPTGFYWQWDVQLYDIAVTKAELGWKLDSKTVLGPDEPYTAIEIKLNASTGELVSKQAEIPQVW